jgi:hypothetical protein
MRSRGSIKSSASSQNVPPSTVDNLGKIVICKWPEDARIADLFQGEEIGNAAHLDLAKAKMFFFTLVLVFTFAAALTHTFFNVSSPITELPALDQGMVTLLGISPAGYLTNKAIPHCASS